MDYALFALILHCIFTIAEKNDLNRKLDKMFPDDCDQRQLNNRLRLQTNTYADYVFLIGAVLALVFDFIKNLVN